MSTAPGAVGTHRDNLLAAAKRGNARAADELARTSLPRVFRGLWRHFQTLEMWRGAGGFGASPLTLQDVALYEQRFGVRFLPGTLDLLKRLDAVSLAPSPTPS